MEYKISPFGSLWSDGIFNVPVSLVDSYLKMASEYQIKALLFVLRSNGVATSEQIGKMLGQTAGDVETLLEFWVDEGVLSLKDGEADTIAQAKPITPPTAQPPMQSKPEKAEKKKELLSAPRLSPKDVVQLLREDEKLQILVNQAQVVLGRTISHAEQEMLINMVNYYGLTPEVVLMILEFYRSEKESGKSIGISYINAMARDWADEGIVSVADAEEKLKSIERSDRLWNEVVALTGIRHRRPTLKQREMITRWFEEFDSTMITLACDIMKENIPEPKLTYINSILTKWSKSNIKTPADVRAQQEEFEKKKAQRESGTQSSTKLKSKPSYDLEKIKKDAMNNTEI